MSESESIQYEAENLAFVYQDETESGLRPGRPHRSHSGNSAEAHRL
ncbi:hypothetical protein RBH26_00865 [Natronolimnohabitans sp. A-GB9]|nr:hypothetical protein [Natronolimnohabitans sp. A-GB9]MDQ2049027.1 hypothetical protein [Natronolimnohabitans sp. A-GB9]